MQLRTQPNVFLAGQITGVEGYVESCASGFVCAVLLSQTLRGLQPAPPPPETALGGVITHITRDVEEYQPSNVTWAWLPPLENRRLKKHERCEGLSARALDALTRWMESAPYARTLAA
jgi:methylenetetrahydrofolate--tRNA-(uracil-5-)-methyltransferase